MGSILHRSLFTLLSVLQICNAFDPGKVIFAVNAGGDVHVDSTGIRYERDPLHNLRIGTASDYGKSLSIRRVAEKDFELYQVERYHHNSFGYEIPVIEDGDYVLVLKFCEVYFNSRNSKVFDVALNGVKVIENLDIFDKVGKGVAHDEYVPFSIRDNVFVYNNIESFINNGKIKVEFLKGRKDNPKINAIIVYKGSVHDFPRLPHFKPDERMKYEYPEMKYKKKPGSPGKQQQPHDPYATEQPTMMWPVCVLMVIVFLFFYNYCRI